MSKTTHLFISMVFSMILLAMLWLVLQAESLAQPCSNHITVSSTADSGPGTLRQALADVCSGGTIDFAPALANQVVTLTSGELMITQTVTLENPNAPNLKLNGNDAQRIFHLQSGAVVTMSNLSLISGTITSGSLFYDGGGGIRVGFGTTLTVLDSHFTDNTGVSGGAIQCFGTLKVYRSVFNGNVALTDGGGAIYSEGSLIVEDSSFSGNSGQYSGYGGGGGIYNDGSATITNSHFYSNTSSYSGGGGGIVNWSGLTVNNSEFKGNSASLDGGGIRNHGTATINASTFISNAAISPVGGGGGGITNEGVLIMTDSFVTDNLARVGGGIDNSGDLVITNTTISFNSATVEGGGIHNQGSSANIDSTTINGNSAPKGGGIATYIALSLTNSTLSGNSSSSSGGGIYTGGVTDLNHVTITGNSAMGYGGGINNFMTVNLRNSILAGNMAPSSPDCFVTINSQGYNLIQNTEDCTINGDPTGNLIGVSPNLDSLADNGGDTLTHALLDGSPAIDKGSCGETTVDQRGYDRLVDNPAISNSDDGCDIGAFEFGAVSNEPPESSELSIYVPLILK